MTDNLDPLNSTVLAPGPMPKLDRIYLRMLITVTIGLVALSVGRLLPPRLVGGGDLAVYRAAAFAVLHGQDPYLKSVIARSMTATHAPADFIGQGALFAYPLWVALIFLWSTLLPLNAAYLIWALISIGLVAYGLACLADWAGWTTRLGLVALGTFTFAAFIDYSVGNVDPLLLVAVAWAIVWATRGRWLLAGLAAMMAAMLKPQVAWPIVPFLLVVAWPQRESVRRALAGQLVGLGVLAGLPSLVRPDWVAEWVGGLVTFSKTIPQIQPDPAQLAGALRILPSLRNMPLGFGNPLTWGLVGVALLGMAVWARWLSLPSGGGQLRSRDRIGWGLGLPLLIWALASPYIHTDDLVALAPVFVLLLSPDWWGATGRRCWLLCLALAILPDSYRLIAGRFGGPWVLTSLATLWLGCAAGYAIWSRVRI